MLKKRLKTYLIEFISSKFQLDQKKLNYHLDKLLDEISLHERVYNNFRRIIENDYYITIYLENVNCFYIYLEIILKISAFSNYLTDIMVRNPEFLTRFLSSGELYKNFSLEDFKNELAQQICIYKSNEKKLSAIRRFKRLHMLRIGLRDILNLCELEQTMLEYSYLTQSILDKVFELAFDINRKKISLKDIPNYVLVSLGKLGGNELNFSSDVDLICIYDNPLENISSEVLDFYDRVVKDFIHFCTESIDGSLLYRIDFRLRPDGKYAPLARSLSYYRIYYETYGRDWERQMLLKLNYVGGDKKLFDKFKVSIQSFIFPKVLLISPKNFIKKFRNIYLEKISEFNSNEILNLKHFRGGIRDVEFSVQALQLLHGGNFKELRAPNTIESIEKLIKYNLIKNNEGKKLIQAYKFLRRIENFIQLMDDRQLHNIPNDKDKFENLIKYIGLKNKNEFNIKLKSFRRIVEDFSNKVFERDEKNIRLKLLRNSKINSNIELKKSYTHLMQLIHQKIEFHTNSFNDQELKNFESVFIKTLRKSQNPEKYLNNFLKFVSNTSSSFQIVELIRNKNLFKTISEIFENSEPLSQYLITEKEFIDSIFSGTIFHKFNFNSQLTYSGDHEIKKFIFHLMFNFFTGNLKSNQVQEYITTFIERYLSYIITKSIDNHNLNENQIVIISLGSFGNREMHFKSDVDLLFICSNDIDELTAEKFSFHVLSDLRTKFRLFDFFQADSKLRPEGTVSKLCWSINEIEKYIFSRMRIWEFQAYTKMRLLYGNKDLFNKICEMINTRVKQFDKKFVAAEIKKNRTNIKSSKITSISSGIDLKNSSGGLMDLQFMLQYQILLSGFDSKIIGNTFNDSLKFLKSNENLNRTYLKQLQLNYQKLMESILIKQTLTGKKSFIIDKNFDSKYFRRKLKVKNSQSIFDFYNSLLKNNFHILQKICPEIF